MTHLGRLECGRPELQPRWTPMGETPLGCCGCGEWEGEAASEGARAFSEWRGVLLSPPLPERPPAAAAAGSKH